MSDARDFGLAPALRARLMAVFLLGIGAVLVVTTFVVAVAHLPPDVLSVVVVLAVVAIVGLGFLLVRRWYVVRVDDVGYRVRFVRGAGASRARWADVDGLDTAVVSGARCAVLRLRDGRSTTVPVDLIEGSGEDFVDELRDRLRAAQRGRRRP